jgi:mono/diheme cytochrome c family protein
MRKAVVWLGVLLLVGIAVVLLWVRPGLDTAVPDDAKAAGKTVADFPQTASHALDAMDGGLVLTDEEREGRNTWILWTAGDQVFWDRMAQHGLGTADLLKTIDSRMRGSRFQEMGLVNQPGFEQATQSDQYGLWLDNGPQEDGVDPVVYGRPSGIVGLRVYPNPKFDDAARKAWDPKRYFSDPNYYNDPKLVRPYVVGMSCGFCHVSFNPVKPPDNPESSPWENLSSTIGNQYFNSGKIFGNGATAESYVYQLFHSWAAGTVDTSFIATDNLNNPGAINAIYAIPARMTVAHEEEIAGGALNFPGEQRKMLVPHVLKDGADSVGLIGALSRVYVSIGEYSQEWLRDHNALVGGKPQHPFEIAKAQKNSVYWQATAERLPNLAKFLMKMEGPKLANAPSGKAYLTQDKQVLQRGRAVFAETCARCHSSKQPPADRAQTRRQYSDWMRAEVQEPNFLEGNFLSNEERIPANTVETNVARALATNATSGHVWDNFSSQTYKTLSSVGAANVLDPLNNSRMWIALPGGGPGYYRVPSLIGIWATAPFLHNNALGSYTGDPSVAGRMKAFDDAAEKLLWPEKRLGLASIARTTVDSYIEIPAAYLPDELQSLSQDGFLRIGPIPAGTPIDLIANADLDLSNQDKVADRIQLIAKVQADLLKIKLNSLGSKAAQAMMSNLVPELLKISKCPDFVLDRGHTFGANLPDQDKRALIEYMKTF